MLKRFESGWPAADVRALVGRYSAGLRAEGVTLGEEWALANIKKLLDCLE